MNELQGCLADIMGINQARCVQSFEAVMFVVPHADYFLVNTISGCVCEGERRNLMSRGDSSGHSDG